MTPLSDEGVERARQLAAEIKAGHPHYGDRDYDELLVWEREVVNLWALNLQSVLSGYVPGLLARLDAAEKVVDLRDPIDPSELHDAIWGVLEGFECDYDAAAAVMDLLVVRGIVPPPDGYHVVDSQVVSV